MRKCFAVTVVVLAALAAGCRGKDVLTPLQVRPQTQFVLHTARGNTLPVIEFSDETRTTQVVADTMTLRSDGAGARRTRYLRREGVPARDSLFTIVTPLVYRLDGSKIIVGWGCAWIDICPAIYTINYLSGEVTRTGILFDKGAGSAAGNVVPLVYEQRR